MKQQRGCDDEQGHNPEGSAEWSKRHYDSNDDGEEEGQCGKGLLED